MKPAVFLAFLFLLSTAARAEETAQPTQTSAPPTTSSAPSAAPDLLTPDLLALCPPDMPPACACVAQGKGVRVMPANEAYKSRLKVLLVGPKT